MTPAIAATVPTATTVMTCVVPCGRENLLGGDDDEDGPVVDAIGIGCCSALDVAVSGDPVDPLSSIPFFFCRFRFFLSSAACLSASSVRCFFDSRHCSVQFLVYSMKSFLLPFTSV
jgi:hypothetical protein